MARKFYGFLVHIGQLGLIPHRSCPANIGGTVAFPNKTAQFDRIFLAFTTQGGNVQSEDCLSVNIWVKGKPEVGEDLKPVLVFYPGGSELRTSHLKS